MEPDNPVRWRYEVTDEDARLWRPGIGDLVRLRTWEILERVIPSPGRVLDVGGGPGAHAAHLATLGHTVHLTDPVSRHIESARARAAAQADAPFTAEWAMRSSSRRTTTRSMRS